MKFPKNNFLCYLFNELGVDHVDFREAMDWNTSDLYNWTRENRLPNLKRLEEWRLKMQVASGKEITKDVFWDTCKGYFVKK